MGFLGISSPLDEHFILKVDNLDDFSVAGERLVWASADLKGKELPPELIAKKEVKTILEARLPELGITDGLDALRKTSGSFLPIQGLNALLTDPVDQGNGFSLRTHKVSGRVFVFCSNAPHLIITQSFDKKPEFIRGGDGIYTIKGESAGKEVSVNISAPGIMIRNIITQLNNPRALLTSTGSEVLRKGDLRSQLDACFPKEHGNSPVDFEKLDPKIDLNEAVQRLWPIKKIVGAGRFQIRGNGQEMHIFDVEHGIILGESVKDVKQVARNRNNGWAGLVVTKDNNEQWVDLRDGQFIDVDMKDYTVYE